MTVRLAIKLIEEDKIVKNYIQLGYSNTLIAEKLNKNITPKEIIKARKEFRTSVIVRNVYSEVLNILQATVMMKLSKKNNKKENKSYLNDALMTSIAGISAAIKNTG